MGRENDAVVAGMLVAYYNGKYNDNPAIMKQIEKEYGIDKGNKYCKECGDKINSKYTYCYNCFEEKK